MRDFLLWTIIVSTLLANVVPVLNFFISDENRKGIEKHTINAHKILKVRMGWIFLQHNFFISVINFFHKYFIYLTSILLLLICIILSAKYKYDTNVALYDYLIAAKSFFVIFGSLSLMKIVSTLYRRERINKIVYIILYFLFAAIFYIYYIATFLNIFFVKFYLNDGNIFEELYYATIYYYGIGLVLIFIGSILFLGIMYFYAVLLQILINIVGYFLQRILLYEEGIYKGVVLILSLIITTFLTIIIYTKGFY